MTRTGLCIALTAGLAACSTPTGDSEPVGRPGPAEASCNAEAVQDAVGSSVTQALGTELVKRSGARSLRWGPPGAVFTMDYRQDRLNVIYDADSVVTRIYCG